MRIAITGSSGFVGSNLAYDLETKGNEVIRLPRHIESQLLEGVDVIINLSGENIFGRWNKSKMEAIRESRVKTTQNLVNILEKLQNPPKLYIGASAIGYYGDRKEEVLDESSAPGKDFFLADVCQQWEEAAKPLTTKNIRVVFTRFGIILGKGGGALQQMEKAFKTGMGGTLGSGKQMMSWIALDDVLSAIHHIIEHPELNGPVNFAAPKAVSNAEFTQVLARVLNKPAVVAVPKFALNLIFGEGAEMFLASTNVVPKHLLESGYHFQYPELEAALRKYLV